LRSKCGTPFSFLHLRKGVILGSVYGVAPWRPLRLVMATEGYAVAGVESRGAMGEQKHPRSLETACRKYGCISLLVMGNRATKTLASKSVYISLEAAVSIPSKVLGASHDDRSSACYLELPGRVLGAFI
jgi:hypothetical protein